MAEQPSFTPASPAEVAWLKSTIRDVPDYPKPGILFKDITTLLNDQKAFTFTVDKLSERFVDLKPKHVVGLEARGFIFGAAVAHHLGIGFIPVRKPGKLPYKTEKVAYALEYGTDTLEIHSDAVEKGDRVIIIDDLLATGGTAAAAATLLKTIGAEVVGIGFVTELLALKGREKMPSGVEVFSILQYD